LTFQRAAEDFRLGGLGFLAALLPVYCVQAVMIQFVPPDKHPVLQMLSEHSTPVSLAVAVFFAVVVAPLAEEFLFRAFLQGWLESSAWKQALMRAFERSRRVEAPADVMPIDFDAASLDGAPIVDGVPQTAVSGPAIDELATYVPARPDYLAILVSSAVFAALHASNWPAPIPLFFLALILGYLYHRTHRLLPCIVVHLLFNGLSVAAVMSGMPVK
jgi:membrane protease YdiL (CAAX protease family)